MRNFSAPICVACGNEMVELRRMAYRRCTECTAVDRPHSLALARQVRAFMWQATYGLDDHDPAGSAAAAA